MKSNLIGKRKQGVFLISASALLFIGLLSWLYVFDTYEVRYEYSYNDRNQLSIVGIPLNAFGKEVPFRTIISTFRVIDSEKYVKIKSTEKDKAIILWDEEKLSGKIKIGAKNSLSRWENIITIPIKISEEI